MFLLSWEYHLCLYERRGFQFYLTERGQQITEERQQMTPVEVRALIRNALQGRTRNRVLSENEGDWTEEENAS